MADLTSLGVDGQPSKRAKLRHDPVERQEDDIKCEDEVLGRFKRDFDEQFVGITEFLGSHRPFEAILKNRFEDFVVNEISKSGEVVRLTDMSIPEEEEENKTTTDIDELLTKEHIDQLKLIEDGANSQEVVKIDVTNLDKKDRQKIHEAIRSCFKKIETNTKDMDEGKFILASRLDQRSRTRSSWPKNRPDYTNFVLCKRNADGQEVINKLADKTGVSAKSFSFAGTKDKRAITTQRLCVWRTDPKKIANAAKCFGNLFKVGNFSFQSQPLKLGDLNGNFFQIVLRNLRIDDKSEIEKAVESLNEKGFINYFGLQRFSNSKHSMQIGIKLLKSQWKEAVNLILSPKAYDLKRKREDVPTFNESMKEFQETGDAKSVFQKFQYKHTPEGLLLKGLSKNKPNAYLNALCQFMPRNMRLMYIHCYQSFLFNHAASHRIKNYGLQVVPGDLLLFDDVDEEDVAIESNEKEGLKCKPIYADENNISRATIYDVVLPLPGKLTDLPRHDTGEFYLKMLKDQELSLTDFEDKSKLWMLQGSYRKLVVKPKSFSWSLVEYSDANKPLVRSDFYVPYDCPEQTPNQKNLALKISVALPTSTYATIMVRELTKTAST